MTTPNDIPNIVATVRRAWPVGDEAMFLLASYMTPVKFARNSVMIAADQRHGVAFFVEKGMTRSYWLVDGEEITTSFLDEGGLVFSMDEVYYSLPSQEFVAAVEPIIAYAIKIPTLLKLIATNIELCNWWRVIHQNEYRRLHRSHKERLTLNARQRYEAFAQQFPEAMRRARLYDIASYLGINPSTLSHIRSYK